MWGHFKRLSPCKKCHSISILLFPQSKTNIWYFSKILFVRHSFQTSFDVRPFLRAALSKFISVTLQNYRPWIASGLPEEVLFLIQTHVPFPPTIPACHISLKAIDSIILVELANISLLNGSLWISVLYFLFTPYTFKEVLVIMSLVTPLIRGRYF